MNNDKTPLSFLNKDDHNLVLLVRHRGCTFCRESLTELSKAKHKLLKKDLKIYVIHMGPEESSQLMQDEFDLAEAHFISDPNRKYYKYFGARRGKLTEVLGAKVLKKGLLGGSLLKHGVGKLEGDGFQLGGLYYVHNDIVECWHQPEHAGDIENWERVIKTADQATT